MGMYTWAGALGGQEFQIPWNQSNSCAHPVGVLETELRDSARAANFVNFRVVS